MATLTDQRQLAEAFSPPAGFLERYISSRDLQQRWRVSRTSLLRYERQGMLPSPKWAFGKLWYTVSDIDKVEANLFGRPAGGES